jgi:hypothetical protein
MKMLSDITIFELEEIFQSLPCVAHVKPAFEYYKENAESLTGLGEAPIGILVHCSVDMLNVIVHLDLLDGQSTAYYDAPDERFAYFPWANLYAELFKRGYLSDLLKQS